MKGATWVIPPALTIVFLASCSGTRPHPPADLILSGGPVVGLAPTGSFDAVAISGDRIIGFGASREILALRGPDTTVVELDGAVVIPGFVDHHVHLLNLGQTLLNAERGGDLFLDLGGAASLDELAALVRRRAESLPPGSWIVGKGWSQGAWGETRLPDHRVLSQAAPDHPVYLTRVDGHAGWANQKALELAGIDSGTPDPPAGSILRTPDGEPSGVLLERANEPILSLLPQPSAEEVRRAFRLAAEKLAQQGLVEAFDAGFLAFPGIVGLNADLAGILRLLRQEDAEKPLPLRVNLMIPAPSALADAILADPDSYRDLSPRLRVTHLKLFADGAMGSRGAALSEPFADDPSMFGVPRMSADEIRRQTERALDSDLDVAVHAIGDEAVRRALDAFEVVLAARPDTSPRRLRIEHFSFAREEDFERAVRLGVGLSVQPNFVAPDDRGLTMEDSRVGAGRIDRVYAWRRLAATGAVLAGGSDYFDKPGPALLTFYCAATRANPSGLPAQGWHPGERLSRERALELSTAPLRPGGGGDDASWPPADLTILSADPLTEPVSGILGIEVLAVIGRGRVTFHGPGLPDLPHPE